MSCYILVHYRLKNLRLFIFILILVCCCNYKALTQEYSFVKYSVKEGLPSGTVLVSFQDSHGFIWVGSEAGLSRFDGRVFKNFSTSSGLLNNSVRCLAEDKDGNIWAGTAMGISVLFPDGHIKNYTSSTHGFEGDIVNNIFIDRNNTKWFSTKKGLYRFSKNTKPEEVEFSTRGSKERITTITEDKNGLLLLGTTRCIYRQHEGEFFPCWNTDTVSYYVRSILCLKNGDLVFTALHNSIYKVSGNSVFKYPIELSSPAVLMSTDTTRDEFWVVTFHDLIEYKNGKFSYLCIAPLKLPNEYGFVSSMFDREKSIWLASNILGLIKLRPSNVENFLCDSIFSKLKSPFAISGKGNRVLIASASSIYALDSTNKLTKIMDSDLDFISNYVLECSNGSIWSGYGFNSLVKINPDGTKQYYQFGDMMRETEITNVMYEDSKFNLWIGSTSGIYFFSKKTNKIMPLQLSGEVVGAIRQIYEHAGKGLFISSKKGLFHLYKNKLIKVDNNTIDCFVFKDSLSFWAGTAGNGVLEYSFTKHTLLPQAKPVLDEKSGLKSNFVKAMVRDKDKNLWICTNTGISYFSTLNKRLTLIKNLGPEDGVLTNYWRFVYLALDKNNSLWCATGTELMKLRSIKPQLRTIPINVCLLSYSIEERENQVVNKYEVNQYDSTDHRFLPNTRAITFDFVALSYINPSEIQYAVLLDGYDNNWRVLNTISQVSYMNLPSGKYAFRIRASKGDGKWYESRSSFKFEMLKPFWEEWWFLLLIWLIVIVIAVLIFRRWLISINRKAHLNTEMTELKLRALRAQLNPHFIFNSLSSIQHIINSGDIELATVYLTKFSKLLRLILNVSEKSFIPLTLELDMLGFYLDLEMLRLNNRVRYEIEADRDEIEDLSVPTLLIQPYVENAIWHGLHSSLTPGLLKVSVKVNEDLCIIVIEDNGIGRKRSAELKRKNTQPNEGKSMKINSSRVNIIDSAARKGANIMIIDIYNEKFEPAGTKVKIELPLSELMKNANV